MENIFGKNEDAKIVRLKKGAKTFFEQIFPKPSKILTGPLYVTKPTAGSNVTNGGWVTQRKSQTQACNMHRKCVTTSCMNN